VQTLRSIALAAVLVIVLGGRALAFDEAAFCRQIDAFNARGNAKKGQMVDPLTRNEGMHADCQRRTVEFLKSVAVAASELTPPWLAAKQKEWSDLHCKDRVWSAMMSGGWQIVLLLATFDGKQLRLVAQCAAGQR